MEHDAGPADLPEGGMRVVDIDGTPMLLARVEGRCHAVGNRCPHAGAPLNEGVLHEGTIICPWHKAAFRLADGRCVEPPAVDDLPRYTVRESAGRLLAAPVPCPAPATGPEDSRRFLILGAGAAGVAAAQTLREHGFAGRIVMVSSEPELPYDRTLQSKYALSGKQGGEKTPLHGAAFYDQHRIERLTATIRSVDPASRVVTLADGTALGYDAALLATGARPRPLDVPGAALPGVFTLRSAAAAAIVAAIVAPIVSNATPPRHVVVAGAGFIGMEAAAALCERGLEVTVVAPDDVPFAKLLGPEVGAAFRRVHERAGIRFRLGDQIDRVEGDGRVQFVHLRGGATLPADIVLVGTGVTPATGMLHGIPLRKDHGVDVDPHLRLVPGLFAAGDLAAFPHRGTGPRIRVEHWRVAQQHGRVAALNMLGDDVPYDAVPYFWTIHFMQRLDYVGHAEDWDEVTIDGDLEKPEFTAFYLKDGRVQAVAGWARDQAMARAITLMTARQDWTLPSLRAAL